MASGVSAAATVRISNSLGEKKVSRIRTVGFSAIIMVLIFMGVSGIIFILLRNYLPNLFIIDIEVIAIASVLMIIAGLFQILDGAQVTALGALRGIQDVKLPTYITLISYWAIGLPISYLFGVVLDYGVTGVWVGYIFGLSVSATVLTTRFSILSKRLSDVV